jgi:NTP pyrophosphatase (non-canonical NTP hydrolase)
MSVDHLITNDEQTTIHAIRQMVGTFVAQRNWSKFHSPKNISMALAVEAAELMEHFQWIEGQESREPDSDKKVAIGEELADVLCYAMAIANELEIDVAGVMKRKMELNRAKYPVEEFRGRYGRDDPNPAES